MRANGLLVWSLLPFGLSVTVRRRCRPILCDFVDGSEVRAKLCQQCLQALDAVGLLAFVVALCELFWEFLADAHGTAAPAWDAYLIRTGSKAASDFPPLALPAAPCSLPNLPPFGLRNADGVFGGK